jgi:hypothetical protein
MLKNEMITKAFGIVILAGASLGAQAQRFGGNDNRGGYDPRGTVIVNLQDRERCMRSRSDREEVDCFRDITDPRRGYDGGGQVSSCVAVSLCVDQNTELTIASNYINATNAWTLTHFSCPAHLDGVILLGLGREERAIRANELPMSLPLRGTIESFAKLSGRGDVQGSVSGGVLKIKIKDDAKAAGVYSINVCTTGR